MAPSRSKQCAPNTSPRSQWQSPQRLHLEGHIFYSVSFPYKGELARLGGGAGGGNQLRLPRELQLLLQMAPRAHFKGYARLCVPGVPVTWRLPSPLAPHCSGLGIAPATGWSRTARQGGRGGTRGHTPGQFPWRPRGATRDGGAGTSRLPTLSFSGPSALAKRRAPLCATAERGHSAQLEPCNSVPLNPRRGGRAVAARSREDRGSLRVSPRPPTSNTPAAVLPWCMGFPVHSGKGGQLQREGRGKGYSHSTPRGSFPEAAWFLLRTSTRKDTRWGC